MKRETKDDRAISVWDWTCHELDSQYGRLTFRRWCEREMERADRHGVKTQIADGPAGSGLIRLERVA